MLFRSFGKYAMQEEQGHFTEHGYISLSGLSLIHIFNYSEEENPLALKSDFVLSFCELIMGSKTGLETIEKTVFVQAVQMIYQPYFADSGRPDKRSAVPAHTEG